MTNSNDYDDGQGNARVTMTPDSGSIYSHDSHEAFTNGSGVQGGLFSGGLTNEKNGEAMRVSTGSPGNLNNFEARTQDGWRVNNPSELQPTDIVTVSTPDGAKMEVEYKMAVELGLIRGDANGRARGATQEELAREQQQAAEREQQEADKEAKDATGEAFADTQANGWLADAVSKDAGSVLDVAISVIDGDSSEGLAVPESIIQSFADTNGISAPEAKARIDRVAGAYQAEAVKVSARSVGVPEWLAQEALVASRNASGMRDLMMQHVNTGKPAGYDSYVRDYVSQMDQTPTGQKLILEATGQLQGRVRSDGERVIVRLGDGTETTWANAISQGLIRLS
jgi:hypothetical protein